MKPALSFALPGYWLAALLAGCAILLAPTSTPAAPAVVGLWRFNEGSGTNAYDSSGLGNNGVLAGENGNVPVYVAGQPGFGSALLFTNDGTDHAYVSIPGASSLMIGQTATNTWTITAWAYEDSNGTGILWPLMAGSWSWTTGTRFNWNPEPPAMCELYTWARANAAWQIAWGHRHRRWRHCWTSGCTGPWFMTAPTSPSIATRIRAPTEVSLPCRWSRRWASRATRARF